MYGWGLAQSLGRTEFPQVLGTLVVSRVPVVGDADKASERASLSPDYIKKLSGWCWGVPNASLTVALLSF